MSTYNENEGSLAISINSVVITLQKEKRGANWLPF